MLVSVGTAVVPFEGLKRNIQRLANFPVTVGTAVVPFEGLKLNGHRANAPER